MIKKCEQCIKLNKLADKYAKQISLMADGVSYDMAHQIIFGKKKPKEGKG